MNISSRSFKFIVGIAGLIPVMTPFSAFSGSKKMTTAALAFMHLKNVCGQINKAKQAPKKAAKLSKKATPKKTAPQRKSAPKAQVKRPIKPVKKVIPAKKQAVRTSKDIALQRALLASLSKAPKIRIPAVQPALPNVVYEKVTRQKGADCGYHALYNAWRKHEELQGHPRPDFPLEQWRSAVVARRKQRMNQFKQNMQRYNKAVAQAKARKQKCRLAKPNKDFIRELNNGALIDDGEIEQLVRSTGIPAGDYTILPDIVQWDPSLPRFQAVGIDAIITKLQRPGTSHGFIIGDMEWNEDDDYAGTVGHWIAVVAHRINANTLRYYVMDSMNGKPYDTVLALQNILEDDFAAPHAPIITPSAAFPRSVIRTTALRSQPSAGWGASLSKLGSAAVAKLASLWNLLK